MKIKRKKRENDAKRIFFCDDGTHSLWLERRDLQILFVVGVATIFLCAEILQFFFWFVIQMSSLSNLLHPSAPMFFLFLHSASGRAQGAGSPTQQWSSLLWKGQRSACLLCRLHCQPRTPYCCSSRRQCSAWGHHRTLLARPSCLCGCSGVQANRSKQERGWGLQHRVSVLCR